VGPAPIAEKIARMIIY